MTVTVGLVSDTHGVFDPQLADRLHGVAMILHAGDVGHHGTHAEVLAELQRIAPVTAVRGNVDDGASLEDLPEVQVLHANGWHILMTHICGMPPKVNPAARLLLAQHKPDIIIFGHSHVYGHHCSDGVWFLNSGSAGPARFKLRRTAALLHLPEKGPGAVPRLECLDLEGKAPPRLCAESRMQRPPTGAPDGDLRHSDKTSRLGKRRR